MRSRILKCPECGKYTLMPKCPKCSLISENTFPPRYSPEDRFGKYRRMALYGELTEEGLQ